MWESETKVLHFTDGGKPWEFILPETGEEVAENGGGEKREGGWNSLRRWFRGEDGEKVVGREIWVEGYRIWQREAAEEGVCGWQQHVEM